MDKKSNETYLVFVYGTLKAGQSNHQHFMTGSAFVGKGTTVQPYVMHSNGGFPVVFPMEDKPVAGELYEISGEQLSNLDRLEGHPRFFRREEIEVRIDDPVPLGTTKCWMYFGVPKAWSSSLEAGLPKAKTDGDGAYNWSRETA